MRAEWRGDRFDGQPSHGSPCNCCKVNRLIFHGNSATLGSREAHGHLSNYRQDVDLARSAVKFGLELVHLLLYCVPVLLDQPGLRPLTAAMIEGEGFFAGIERGPNVVADQ